MAKRTLSNAFSKTFSKFKAVKEDKDLAYILVTSCYSPVTIAERQISINCSRFEYSTKGNFQMDSLSQYSVLHLKDGEILPAKTIQLYMNIIFDDTNLLKRKNFPSKQLVLLCGFLDLPTEYKSHSTFNHFVASVDPSLQEELTLILLKEIEIINDQFLFKNWKIHIKVAGVSANPVGLNNYFEFCTHTSQIRCCRFCNVQRWYAHDKKFTLWLIKSGFEVAILKGQADDVSSTTFKLNRFAHTSDAA